MKHSILAAAIAACIGLSGPAFAGVPTVAPATDAQLALQLNQLLEQFKVMQQQYDQLRQQYAATTGSTGIGNQGLDISRQTAGVVPGSWQDVVSKQSSGAYGASQARYDAILKSIPAEAFADPQAQDAKTYRMNTDLVRAAMAGGDQLYGAVGQHLQVLIQQAEGIETDATLKNSADRHNAILSQQAMVQVQLARMTVMNNNLQAAMLNEQSQGQAAVIRYFTPPPAAAAKSARH